MRIGVIAPVDWVRELPFGGSSRVIGTLAPYFSSDVFLLGISVGRDRRLTPIKLASNTYFVPLFRVAYPSRVPVRVQALTGYLFAKRRIRKLGLDLLYIHSPESAVPFLVGTRIAPVVYHQHGSLNPIGDSRYTWARNSTFRRLYDQMHAMVHSRADATIAVDPLSLAQARANSSPQRTSLISNPIDTAKFFPDSTARQCFRAAHGFAHFDVVLLFAGRLTENKNPCLVLEALYRARAVTAPWYAVIAGQGPVEDTLRQQARALGLADRVIFLGHVGRSQMPALYNGVEVLVLPSSNEGVPMVLLEALACGTPVVASEVGGVHQIVQHGTNGFLLHDPSSQAIKESVGRCLEAEWHRDHLASTVSHWSADRVARQIECLFSTVLSRNGTGKTSGLLAT